MRPTTSTMLQQNNNNNYPCLNMSGSTREMLQKCSRAALPFPSRLELGDLPLIRGLRAWALCSKNRRKAGGLLGGGQSPTAPLPGRGNLTSCTKPADVFLSGEWTRMEYGLPLGLGARQAEIGALVTVATLKTSEGSGKTQTQCLFLQTEKGSRLYSTAKPGSGVITSAGSSVVGGWLRGKTGGGGSRENPAGRSTGGPTPLAQTGANRARVGSGRRWRKSGYAAGREKPVVSRERQQRSREDPAGEITLEERKEVQDKGGSHSKQFLSPQHESKKARQEKEGVCRTPRCCHNVSPKLCMQCRRRAQRGESQEEQEGGESPSSEKKGMRRERQKNKEEEEGGVCELGSSNLVLAASNPDPDSTRFHCQCPGGCDVDEIREAECDKELNMQSFHSEDKFSEKERDTNFGVTEIHSGNNAFIHVPSDFKARHDRGLDEENPHCENSCEDVGANRNGFTDHVDANELGQKKESADIKEEETSITQTYTESSVLSVSVSNCPASISSAFFPESSHPLGGSVCTAELKICSIQKERGKSQEERLKGYQKREEDGHLVGEEEPHEVNFASEENNTIKFSENGKPQVFFKDEENKSSPLRQKDSNISETDEGILADCHTNDSEQRDELVSEEDNTEKRRNPESGGVAVENLRKKHELNDEGNNDSQRYTEANVSAVQEENYEVEGNCALKDSWSFQESEDGCGNGKKVDVDSCSQIGITPDVKSSTNVTNVSSPALCLANPAPSLAPLGSMATGLPCVLAEEEEEEGGAEGVGLVARDGEGGQEGKRGHRGELEEQAEGETEEGRNTEEDDEFGVFMQASGGPAWSKGFAMSASVPCGSGESVALGSRAITGDSTRRWTPGWTDSSFPQSDDAWTAFPYNPPGGSGDVVGQWWPTSAVEEGRETASARQNVVSVFAEAFPSPPGLFSPDPHDLHTVPTLTQLLTARADQDQGLLDSFHDLNKMIGHRYKRANGVSRDLLLKTLRLEQPQAESRPAPWTSTRRLSPGLSSAYQHAQNAAAKRRLSCDYSRNVTE